MVTYYYIVESLIPDYFIHHFHNYHTLILSHAKVLAIVYIKNNYDSTRIIIDEVRRS